ncbi:MAG: 50S ribosomal protein L11 methyltransferase [Chitinophagales bacterium]|nr:50S ribosomal protein L11 methyltransferase [Chitinophagales bacterium]MBP6154692.1 50S ribosomal protein L11 methyltransferase [Chitinophagales bacterium]
MIHIYSIIYPTSLEKEDFVGLFFELETEGIEEKDDTLDIYINDAQKQNAAEFIHEICINYDITFTTSFLENKNWNEQWERSFNPILIDDFVYVRATFHPQNSKTVHEIIIEPKMSFGTGHHATTSQMMRNMHSLDFKNKVVLDGGSGTGILAILAEKLGAKHCIALDNDEWCYTNCLENIALNQSKNIDAEIGALENVQNKKFDIILANIHRNFLLENMGNLSSIVNINGYILISGFYQADSKQLLEEALKHHLIANYMTSQEEWTCIVLQKKS